MGSINPKSPSGIRKNWNPLLRRQKTDAIAKEMGITSLEGLFAFSQLTYMDLPFSDLNDLAARFKCDEFKWNSVYAQDMATLLSILVTNNIKCDSWETLYKIVDAYQKGWRERFLISLFCEATSHKGRCGYPLYFSELIGYTRNGKNQDGMLDVMEKRGPDEAFDWLHRRMITKIKDQRYRKKLEMDFSGSARGRVYPFLVFGSPGWASYNQFEKRGGVESLVRAKIPKEVRQEVYIMAICCFSGSFYHDKKHWEGLYSEACKIGIQDLLYFGADTSINICPLFAFLQSEIGHMMANQIAGRHLTGFVGELMDRITMNSYVSYGGLEKVDDELDFSNTWPEAPDEMFSCIEKDLKEIRKKRSDSSYHLRKDWVKKLREM